MKIDELSGALLDYWVARALCANDATLEDWGHGERVCITKYEAFERGPFRPSTVWSDGGRIIERELIGTSGPGCMGGLDPEKYWSAHIDTGSFPGITATGPTPLIAAMRAYVAREFGGEVPDAP